MKELNITSKIVKYSAPETSNVSYQVTTREENFSYEMVNIAGSESEAEAIAESHKAHINQLFNPPTVVKDLYPADDENDIEEEQPKPAKRGRKPKKAIAEDTYVSDIIAEEESDFVYDIDTDMASDESDDEYN